MLQVWRMEDADMHGKHSTLSGLLADCTGLVQGCDNAGHTCLLDKANVMRCMTTHYVSLC